MLKTTLALAAAVLGIGSAIAAAPQPIYVQFSGAAKGALYKPDPALFPSPHVGAVIVMHRDSNYLNHISTKELPERGFVVLGMNPRCDNNEAYRARLGEQRARRETGRELPQDTGARHHQDRAPGP